MSNINTIVHSPWKATLELYKIREPGTKKIVSLTVLKILTKGLEKNQHILRREVNVTLKKKKSNLHPFV